MARGDRGVGGVAVVHVAYSHAVDTGLAAAGGRAPAATFAAPAVTASAAAAGAGDAGTTTSVTAVQGEQE